MNNRKIAMAGVLMMTMAGVAGGASGAAPPPTEARPVTETLHGETVVDPYRWLEGDAQGAMTDEVAKWTDAQNAYTRSVLDALPGRAAVEARLRELMQIGAIAAPQMAGSRYFYTEREGTQNQPVLYVRETFDGPRRALLDVNTLDGSGLTALAWHAPNPDGSLVAFGLYRAGDENATLYVMDVETGRWLSDEIPGRVGSVQWAPDGRSFFYERLADVKDPYSARIQFHRVGEHPRQDGLLFRQFTKEENEKLATTWGPFLSVSRDARWGQLGYFTSTRANDLWAVDLDRWRRTGVFERVEIITGSDSRSAGPIVGDTLFMQTTDGAPNGRVVAVDLNRPARAHWREVVAERADAVIESVQLARGMLVVTYLSRAQTKIERFDYSGASLGAVPLPGIGSASISTEEDRTEAFVSYQSFNEPRSIYRLDLGEAAPALALWARPDVPVDPSIAEVKQVEYASKDGTKVTMFIVHKKGLKLDGDNPTILSGYGGFNISETPFFAPTLFPWFEIGGVYAVPNLRGGGEYGDEWHAAGTLERKQNTFDDFIAAAQWLQSNGYTRPERLGIVGGSNGGLLTGAVLTQRPELFGAVISAVPLLDMLRYQNFLMARYWVPEYGSAENSAQFRTLREYSPYHRVKAGTKYPAVFLTAGENDTRVHPLHARKMAAALQAATAGDVREDPILLWVDRDAGHGGGKPLNLRVRDAADGRMFMLWQLGALDRVKP